MAAYREGRTAEGASSQSSVEVLRSKTEYLHAAVDDAFRNREFAAALTLLTKAIGLDPNNKEHFVKRADASLQLGDPSSAITDLRHALTLLTPDARKETILQQLSLALCLHGEALLREGMAHLALEKFRSLCALDPSGLVPRLKCIACLHILGQPAECLGEVESALQHHPTCADLFAVRARLHWQLGKMAHCFKDVQQALACSGGSHMAAGKLLQCLQNEAVVMRTQALELSLEGRKEEAVKKLSSAIDRNPTLAEYHVFRGSLYRQLGNFNRAQEDFHQAIHKCGLSPDHPTFKLAVRQLALMYNDVAVSMFRKARFRDAVQLLNHSIDVEKGDKVLYTNRGACFYRLLDLEFAIADYEEALALAPWDWSVRTQLAMAHCNAGVAAFRSRQAAEALKHFTRAIECNPKVSRFYICRATLLHLRQDAAGAQRDIICALTLDPEGHEAHALLARVLPGQPAKDVLKTREAVRVRTELMASIANCACLKQLVTSPTVDGSGKEGDGDAVYGIDLCVIDSSELGHSLGVPILDDYLSHKPKETAVLEETNEVASPLPISLTTGNTSPLRVSLTTTGVMPDKSECQQESKFLKALVHTKKENNQAVWKMLQARPDLGRPQPKLDAIPHEIKLGSRTVQPLHATDLSRKR